MMTTPRTRWVALGFLLAACQVLAEPLSIEEIVTLKRVVDVQLAPDGQQIAYVLDVPREPYVDDDGSGYRELHVTDLAGNSRAFVSGEVNVRGVRWSVDGTRLYYLAERDGDEHASLYEIPLAGGESRRLYEHATSIQSIHPSPDGVRIAFLAGEAPPDSEEPLREKGFKAVVYEESARPTRVWLLDLEAEALEAEPADLPGSASALEWSEDGTRYAVALAPTPLVDDFYINRRLHLVEADSGRVLRSIEHAAKLGGFAWSPDGTRIAFLGGEDRNDPLEGRIFIAGVDGESLSQVTLDYEGHIESFDWRGNDRLLYSGARGLWTEIGEIPAEPVSDYPAAPQGDPIVRVLRSRAGVDHVALVADTAEHPPEVYRWSRGGGFERLTHSNPLLEDRDLAVQEAVRYQARDGLEIEGVLIRPFDEGRRHPLILAVHGGPESHYSHGWLSSYTFPAQAMAADGFAFFYPNYRASTGRGVEFSKLDHGDPAGSEFDDLVDAKNHLVDTGLVDPERVGISGGSYGGYATMWGATALTEHFAAGVAFVGLSDLIGSLGTSDIPNELYEVHLRAWPWDDWQFALERSPIYHAGQGRTPLLILGGDADPRVDPSQSLALYRHLKLRTDTPVRLVRYPGEGHGNAATAARLDYALRMQRWMTHYLTGPGGEPPAYELEHAERLEE